MVWVWLAGLVCFLWFWFSFNARGATYTATGAMVRIKDKDYSLSTIRYDLVFDRYAEFHRVQGVDEIVGIGGVGTLTELIAAGGGVGNVRGLVLESEDLQDTVVKKNGAKLKVLRAWLDSHDF